MYTNKQIHIFTHLHTHPQIIISLSNISVHSFLYLEKLKVNMIPDYKEYFNFSKKR